MNAVPVWVQVLLSAMRWGAVCGIGTGILVGTLYSVAEGWFPETFGGLVGLFLFVAFFGTLFGAMHGFMLGMVIGLFAGLTFQLLLRRTDPVRAVVVTVAVVVGVPIVGITVMAVFEPWSTMYFVIPAIAAVLLLRTLHRVASEWASPEIHQHRRDTFAA
ncbi:hypothetical protein GCM10022234_05730 [Aeromicrobium panaciterrae]|uniref:hypothetical protein n=1 Tax=Aeromicrobium panaciterrae TaxID=363861 RepID=UPI0031D1E9F3